MIQYENWKTRFFFKNQIQFSLILAALIFSTHLIAFYFSRQKTIENSRQDVQSELLEIQEHLISVLSVMVLDTNLINSVEQANYAESMKTISSYQDAKIASAIRILKMDNHIYANSQANGAFGQLDSLSSSFQNKNVHEKFQTALAELNNKAHLFAQTELNSLNGPIGKIVIGQNIEEYFEELTARSNSFSIKSIKFISQEPSLSSFSEVEFTHFDGLTIPSQWKIQAQIPALNQLLIYFILQNLILTVISITIYLLWKNSAETNKRLSHEQALRVSSARLVALGEMSAGIAHEINNPLAVIQMSADQMRGLIPRFELPQEFAERIQLSLRRIEQMSQRIMSIITGLRSFSRDGSKEAMLPASLKKIVTDTLEICMARLEHQEVKIKLNLDTPLEMVPCRAIQISQVILNLINNAYDAVEGKSNSWIAIDLHQKNHFAEIWVTDSGPGIAPEIRQKILEPFFTTKAIGKGTGLGLSIAVGILQSHGGTLEIDTECPNTRFVLKIPLETQKKSEIQLSTLKIKSVVE